ncbi:MAG: two-component sensor histidine kinase, partial [Comamonas sp.]|nr:two-component sensor histidine kinase [Candidatus Comamonas equi]
MFTAISQRLYLRIWLAVVGGVAVLTLVVGWAWQVAQEHNARNNASPTAMARAMTITDSNGQVLVQGPFERIRRGEGEVPRFAIESADGATYYLEMTPRPGNAGSRPGGPHSGNDWAFWLRPPFGFLWLLGLVGIAVAVAVFPIIRRLLKRLELLQRGVQRFGEGDLSVRVATHG